MTRIQTVALACIVGLAAAFAMSHWFGNETAVKAQNAPTARSGVPVETSSARAAQVTDDIRAVGSLQSDESVKIAPEIVGRISEILFEEGQEVEKGKILLKFDDLLARAEIAEVEARLELAKANYDRTNTLARTGNVTERARDEATSIFESMRATLELSRVRLAKHSLIAPFAGVVGLRNLSIGAYVNIGTEIVNLEKIDALKIDFKVPELFLSDVKVGQTIEITVDALPNDKFNGTIYAINPMMDVNGRALQVRARLSNPDRVLRPGLFARIVIKGTAQQTVVMVPESALVPRGSEVFVYLIENGKAIETKVQLGERKAGEVAIIEGVEPDATVVIAGHQRLRNGALVEVITPGKLTRS